MPADHYFDARIGNWQLSRVSAGLLNRCNPEGIVAARRRNFLRLQAAIEGLPNLRGLYEELPEGVCPLLFPVVVSDRAEWQRRLNALGAYPLTWWKGYHRNLSLDGFPEAQQLKNSVLAFHIDQHMDEAAVDAYGDKIRRVSRDLVSQARR
jgi:hypothetical protein